MMTRNGLTYVEVVAAWFLFAASLQGRWEGEGREDRQNIYNFMFLWRWRLQRVAQKVT